MKKRFKGIGRLRRTSVLRNYTSASQSKVWSIKSDELILMRKVLAPFVSTQNDLVPRLVVGVTRTVVGVSLRL